MGVRMKLTVATCQFPVSSDMRKNLRETATTRSDCLPLTQTATDSGRGGNKSIQRRKASMVAKTASGASRMGMWPAPGMSSNRAWRKASA